MAHNHSTGHSHDHGDFSKAFAIGIALNTAFVIAEFIYGKSSHSLALVADAGHNLGDVLGLALAWGAAILAKASPTKQRTYGFRRSSVLAAVINAVVLLITVGAIAWEAILRLKAPTAVQEKTVIVVALLGVVVNGATALMFLRGRKSDLNIRGAFAHMASDAAITLGVAAAGVVILYTQWYWLDPALSLVISILIVISTWDLLRDSVNLALDAVPEGIDLAAVENHLRSLPGCHDVHDLHIWGMSTTEAALTVHLVLGDSPMDDSALLELNRDLHARFGIEHCTVQVETGGVMEGCGCTLIEAEGSVSRKQ